MRRKGWAAAVTCALLLTATGLRPAIDAEAAGEIPRLVERAVVKVGFIRSLTSAGFFVALERGYFREANIEIEATPLAAAMDGIPHVATGQLDVASALPGPAFYNALGRGVHLKVVADQFSARPGRSAAAILVRKDLWDNGELREYAQLKGRRVTFNFRGGQFDMMIEEALRRGGLDWKDVNVVMIGKLPDINIALANKATDVAVQIEPLVAAAVDANVAVRWKGLDDLFPGIQNTFYAFSEGFAARRDVARAWTVAYVRGLRDYLDAIFASGGNREEVLGIIMKYVTVKDRKAYDRVVFPGADPNGAFNDRSIREQLAHFTAAGFVTPETAAKVNLDRVLDDSFINYAVSVLGRR